MEADRNREGTDACEGKQDGGAVASPGAWMCLPGWLAFLFASFFILFASFILFVSTNIQETLSKRIGTDAKPQLFFSSGHTASLPGMKVLDL